MSKRILIICGAAMLALGASLTVFAETVYITDHLAVPLRVDSTPTAATLRAAESGEALEVLERQGMFVRVRDARGTEGWVEANMLSPQPPATAQVKALRAELERTRGQLVTAQTQLDKSRTAPAGSEPLQTELAAVRTQLAQAQADLKKSEAAMANVQAAAPAPVPASGPAPKTSGFSFVWLGIAFAMLVLGFIAGIVWVRESIRRRMGGLYLRI